MIYCKRTKANDWKEFYHEENVPLAMVQPNEQNEYSRDVDNVWVIYTNFVSINNVRGNGGAILYSSISTVSKMLIEKCSFHDCNCVGNSGAIDFYGGQCIIVSVCGDTCHGGSRSSAQFGSIYVSESSSKIQIRDLSIQLSRQSMGMNTMNIYSGNVSCIGVNLSNNNVFANFGISIQSAVFSSLSFSTFRRNTGINNGYTCIYIAYSNNNNLIMYTNIIENDQLNPDSGIIQSTSANITMTYCSIYGNCQSKIGYVFYAFDSDASINCYHCSYDKDQEKKTGSGIINLGTPKEKSFINYYEFLEMGSCKDGFRRMELLQFLSYHSIPSTKTLGNHHFLIDICKMHI